MTTQTSVEPRVRVLGGDPTDAELAALITSLMTVAEPPRSTWSRPIWSDRSRTLRTDLPHGPHAWRHSFGP
ncbi:MAG: acyl-CoA carboxylase subunit epsilon [Micrococcales bacterium]|nr:acyl-CoA carboxylase subunit epsilon [Micrococcales bacterium]MCL2668640.1 acyl-CoA carboxylase subunit epsilon [Micrococcales bacterium]